MFVLQVHSTDWFVRTCETSLDHVSGCACERTVVLRRTTFLTLTLVVRPALGGGWLGTWLMCAHTISALFAGHTFVHRVFGTLFTCTLGANIPVTSEQSRTHNVCISGGVGVMRCNKAMKARPHADSSLSHLSPLASKATLQLSAVQSANGQYLNTYNMFKYITSDWLETHSYMTSV